MNSPPTQILSTLTLGEVVELTRHYQIREKMFNLGKIDFRNYHNNNKNFYYDQKKNKKKNFSNVNKNDIVFNLLHTIRDCAFHWENLLKTREKEGRVFPRITHKKRKYIYRDNA